MTILALAAMVLAGCNSEGSNGSGDETITPSASALHIPFQANTFVTTDDAPTTAFIKKAGTIIDTYDGTITNWNDPKTRLSFYMKVPNGGDLTLFVEASLIAGVEESTLVFSCNGQKKNVTVTRNGCIHVGTFKGIQPGYVRVDINGKSTTPSGTQFARIKEFIVEGDVLGPGTAYTPTEQLSEVYWYRRGPSVHLGYTLPAGDVEWFYSEVEVPAGADIPDTYYMLTGFSEGYMGIQTHSDGRNSVLFSVWSPFTTDNPSEIPDEYKVRTLKKGEGVTAQDFGNEGSGGQSFMDYDWKPGTTYRTLVHVRPNGDGSTDYTGYFGDENGNWHLLASFRRPKTNTWYKGAHSFLECFNPNTSIWAREARYRNQWAVMSDGTFKEITECRFTCDNTGRAGVRADMTGGVDGNDFFLRNCGFINEKTAYGSTFSRQPQGNKPEIDFSTLE